MGFFSYLFVSDNTRSLIKIEKIIKEIEDRADKYSVMKTSGKFVLEKSIDKSFCSNFISEYLHKYLDKLYHFSNHLNFL